MANYIGTQQKQHGPTLYSLIALSKTPLWHIQGPALVVPMLFVQVLFILFPQERKHFVWNIGLYKKQREWVCFWGW